MNFLGFKLSVSRAGLTLRRSVLVRLHEMEINNHPLVSYQLIAQALGISPVRVRQIEQRALRKLRKAFKKQGVCSVKDGRDSVLSSGV